MKRFANKVKKPFEYASANESSKPGYLARKFAQIRKRQADELANAPKDNIVQAFNKERKIGP